jgi:hypothetical protein
MPAGEQELVWDGLDASGQKVDSGRYRVRLRAVDPMSGSSLDYFVLFLVDH